jgi:Transposase DDE domain
MRMARAPVSSSTPPRLRGFKYFSLLFPLLARLHSEGTRRDKAGNRELFFDQFATVLIFYFFNAGLDSLRGLQRASQTKEYQTSLGTSRLSLGSLSEAPHVFDPELLQPIIQELGLQAIPFTSSKEEKLLKDLVAVDGSFLRTLPRMVWSFWGNGKKRSAKLHLQFEVMKGVPIEASVTRGDVSEKSEFRAKLQKGKIYVMDRLYAEYSLFRDILNAGSSFVGRLKDNAAYQVAKERPLSAEAKKAGILSDLEISRLGTPHHKDEIRQPLRIVKISTNKEKKDGTPEILFLLTDRLDLDVEAVSLAYRRRWKIEIFFRWFKCILRCRHLVFESPEGLRHQVYAAIIATLLIIIWTGRKATKGTYEMFYHYFTGWASEEDLIRHVKQLQALPGPEQ